MISCKLVVCGESIVRDADTNAVSAFNIIEEMSAPAFPVAVPRLATLFLLERAADDKDPDGAEYVLSLSGRELLRSAVTTSFDGKPRTRVMITVQGLLLPTEGDLRAALHLGGSELAAWTIPVTAASRTITASHAKT